MSIVNNILNMVDLNTTKYNKKLNKMKQDTKRDTKSIGKSFSGIASAWKAALVGIASASLVNAVKKELEATERAVAGFISSFGGVDEARAQFEMLQQAARDTIQPFDALKSVAMNLKRNGIEPTAQQMKTFSQIAYGTGQSLDTVGNAFTSALQGRYKALNQLGIVAKDNGDKLVLTYKGVSTSVEKSAAGLAEYFEKVGKENEGVLDYLQNGMTGALNHLDNAWGDFVRSIGESGLGDLIVAIVRDVSSALDGITGWINKNSPYIKGFFDGLIEGWRAIYETTKEVLNSGLDLVSDFFDGAEKESSDGISNIGRFLSNFFEFARAGFIEYVAKPASKAWQALKGGFSGASEFLAEWLYTGDLDSAVDAFNGEIDKASDEMIKTGKRWDEVIQDQYDKIAEKDKKLREQLGKKLPTAPTMANFSTATIGGKSGGGGGKAAEDGWAKYYQRIKLTAEKNLSDVKQLELQFNRQIAELDEEYAKSRLATEQEYLDAKKILNDEYHRQYAEIEKQAQDFLKEIYGDETVALQDRYQEKLEMLEKYHDDSLVSEEDFLKARKKLYDDYTGELTKLSEKKKKNNFLSEEDIENLETFSDGMTSLSDAFSNLSQGMSETSASYKTLFAMQKAFAVASATMKAALAWMTALSGAKTWYEAIANYATAIAMTTNVLAQLKSVSMHDKGGFIGAGKLGIVGEYGPEIVKGPASVTSRRETADLARSALGGSRVTVNLYEDSQKAGTVDQSQRDGEEVINIFVSNIRKGGQIAQTLQNTYQLRRYGA